MNFSKNEGIRPHQIFGTKLQTTARERHVVSEESERGVHASRVSVRYYNISRVTRGHHALKQYGVRELLFVISYRRFI